MRRLLLLGGLLLATIAPSSALAGIPIGAAARDDLPPKALKVCPLMGRVVDQLGRPLPGVSLRAKGPGAAAEGEPQPTADTTSDDRGWYSLCVGPGEVEVELRLFCGPADCGGAGEHLGHVVHRVAVDPEAGSRRTDLELPTGGVLAGRVFDAEGEPVPWAVVFAPGLWGASTDDATDEDGRFRFETDLVPVGRRAVGARHREHGDLNVWVEVEAGLNELDLSMPRPLATCARVVDDAGEPIGGAEVLLIEPPLFIAPRSGGTTAADGHVALAVPKAGVFYLQGRKEGHSKGRTLPYLIAGEEPEPCRELGLRRAATVVGQVTWAEGLEREPLRASSSGSGPVEVDPATGRFTLHDVPPGRVAVTVSAAEGTRQENVPVEIPPGAGEVPVAVRFERGHDLEVRVLRNGEPAAGLAISLRDARTRDWRSASTDEGGVVRFVGLQPGDYLVEPDRPLERLVRVPHDEPVLVEMIEAELLVEVVDQDGEPVDELNLCADLRAEGLSFTTSGDRLDEPGRFRLAAAPGSYLLRVSAPDWIPVEVPIELPAADVEPVRIELGRGPEVTLRVLGPEGAVPGRVHVSYRSNGDWVGLGVSRRTGPGGEVTLRDLPVGEHEVAVSAAGYAEVRRPVKVPGPVVLFELPLEGYLEVEVPALAVASDTAELRLLDGHGEVQRDGLNRTHRTFWPTGPNELWLAPGVWRVVVTAGDGRHWEGEAVVRGGEVTRLRLEGEGR